MKIVDIDIWRLCVFYQTIIHISVSKYSYFKETIQQLFFKYYVYLSKIFGPNKL